MSKDPREGLKLPLGYEVAREIERTPVIAPGVSDAAVRAINSVLYQDCRIRLQRITQQPGSWKKESGISTSQTLRRRTTLISRTSLLFCNLVGSRAHLETRGHLETKAILELRVHLLDHREDQDLDGHRGLVDQGVQLLWMRHPTPHPMIKDLPMIHHHLLLLR